MSIWGYENKLRRDADRLHQEAQKHGDAVTYVRAAELFERVGDYEQARRCREAASALAKGKGK